jgi:hypothetical protein
MSAPVTLTDELNTAISAANPIPVASLGMPSGVTQLVATSGNVANASAVATLAAVAAKTNYITGFDVTGAGATAGLPVAVTVAGLLGGSITYTYTAAIGVLLANTPLSVRFPAPIPASAVNTAITVTCAALGAGSTNNVVNAYGHRF